MKASTQSGRYTRVAIVLHWAIAIAIIHNLAAGVFMGEARAPRHTGMMNWHVSFGMTVLVLTVIRIVWRAMHKSPPLPGGMKPWEIFLSKFANFLFYFFMVFLPMTGWAILSANPPGRDFTVWWSIRVPQIAPLAAIEDAGYRLRVKHQFEDIHSMGGWILIGLLLLHVAAALKHQFKDGHPGFQRMGIGR